MQNNVNAALNGYEQILQKYPRSEVAASALLRIGILLMGPKENPKRATEAFQSVFEEYPQSPYASYALFYLATAAQWIEDYNRAEHFYQEVLRLYPESELCPIIQVQSLPLVKRKIQAPQKVKKE